MIIYTFVRNEKKSDADVLHFLNKFGLFAFRLPSATKAVFLKCHINIYTKQKMIKIKNFFLCFKHRKCRRDLEISMVKGKITNLSKKLNSQEHNRT